LSNWAG
jgi:Leucine-rich repeat (LRR) protein